MELSIVQIAILIVTVLIARSLGKKKTTKEKDDVLSLYPPEKEKNPRKNQLSKTFIHQIFKINLKKSK